MSWVLPLYLLFIEIFQKKKLELYESDFNSIETELQKLMLETSEWMADIFSLEQKNTNPMLLALLSNYTIRRKNNIDYILVLDNESLQRVENNYLSFNVDITR